MKFNVPILLALLLALPDVRAAAGVPVNLGLQSVQYRHNLIAQTIFGSENADNPALQSDVRASLYFLLGLGHERHAQHIAAINDFSRSLQFKPNAAALIKRGDVRREVNDFAGSADDLEEALRLHPDDPVAWNSFGYTDYARGNDGAALIDFNRAIGLGFRQPGVYTGRGLVYNRQHRYEEALIDFDAAMAASPAFPLAHIGRGEALNRLKRFDEAIVEFDIALKSSPNNFYAVLDRGVAWDGKKDFVKAKRDFTEAARLSPNDDAPHTRLGFVYFDTNKYWQASEEFSIAIKLAPTNVIAYRMRAASFEARGRDDAAVEDYSQAINIQPRNVENYLRRSDVLRRSGNLERAKADLEVARQIEPDNPQIYWLRIRLFEEADAYTSAIDDYTTILRIDPKSTLARIYRADDFAALGRHDAAQRDYEIAGRTDPNNLHLLQHRGILAFYRARYREAQSDFNQWLRVSKSSRANENGDQLPYVMLWLHLCAMKLNIDDRHELAVYASTMDHTKWPYPVFAFYLGSMGEDQLMKAANTGATTATQGQLCEAAAYVGEQKFVRSLTDDARHAFQAAIDRCPADFIEKDLARHELGAIEALGYRFSTPE
ncbi:tetratricopeptide repeat protein [Paraburkholderia sabiae]|uniref:Tetratricopeptide repeat protein n=1 Tax=Paraburkholderia sabiae TaxID=273251 RepID=A0ABU9QLH1_9BURK|nr:tetratricopeptide repeat protein [Paraburkholderia sabiae]WJZ73452.1 tetratricopeptide repeat protein [Paraburkholderia sabiae]CAD6560944.1 Beta-barrel assembly-enhancing protease [Paraburkholderia sabiae]